MSEANNVDDDNVDEENIDEENIDDNEGDLDESEEEGDVEFSEQSGSEEGGAEPRPKRRRRRRKRNDTPLPDDERTRKALEFVTVLIDKMQMDCAVRLRRPKPDSENEINLEISGRDAGRIIGKKGQVLSAIQFLANRVINRPGEDRRYVTVDAEGYRSRRDNSLASMARRLGKQAVTEGKIITFEPMNPRDRRVVHLALAKFEGVITKSEGEGDDRRVQIIPVRR